MSYFPCELSNLDSSGDITSWRTIALPPEGFRFLQNAWERFECALFHGWNALLLIEKERLPTAELASRPLFPQAGLTEYLDWTVGAHLDAYSAIYDSTKMDFRRHGFRHHQDIEQSPLGVVSFKPTAGVSAGRLRGFFIIIAGFEPRVLQCVPNSGAAEQAARQPCNGS